MGILDKFFYRKPPDGLLEINDRLYVFDSCFTTELQHNYKAYVGTIITQLRHQFPDASFLVFNFRDEDTAASPMAQTLSEYDITLMDYPQHYQRCPLLPIEVIHHFLKSSESWLSLGPQNVLLMHCEHGGWPVLAFMLSALLIYSKLYAGEHKTLDMVYKQVPHEHLQLLIPLNPLPSQLRYLHYVSTRNVASEWPPLDRVLTLDCVILRFIPSFGGELGCRPMFRVYGQDPFLDATRTPKVLYATSNRSKTVRLYKQAECELVKIDMNCHIKGDVVLECISLNNDMEHEVVMFRAMFSTAFIRSNILILNRDEIDTLWDAKDRFPKEFRAEVLFTEMDAASSVFPTALSLLEEKDILPIEAFAKVQEIFSHVDWLDPKTDAVLNVLHQITDPNIFHAKLEDKSHQIAETNLSAQGPSPKYSKELQNPTKRTSVTPTTLNPVEVSIEKSEESLFQPHRQSKEVYQQTAEPSQPNPVQCNSIQSTPTFVRRCRSAPFAFGLNSLSKDKTSSTSAESPHSMADTAISPLTTDMSLVPISKEQIKFSILPSPQPPPPPQAPHFFTSKHLHPSTFERDVAQSQETSPPRQSTPPPPPPPPMKTPVKNFTPPTSPPAPMMPPPGKSLSHTPPPAPPTPPLKKSPTIRAGPPPPPLPPSRTTHAQTAGFATSSSPPPPPPPPMKTPPKNSTPPAPPAPMTTPLEKSLPQTPPPAPPTPPRKESSTARSGPPPPPLPPSRTTHAQTAGSAISSSPPPPPPPPTLTSQDSACMPPAPPPPGPARNRSNVLSRSPLGQQTTGKGQGLSRTISSRNHQMKKLKPLHWLKLTKAAQGSLWEEAQKSGEASKAPEIDMSELESLFEAVVSTSSVNSDRKSSVNEAGTKSEKLQLIDHRRAYNCEIMLSRVKIPFHDLMSSVLALEDSALESDHVDNLIKFCPTKEEMELLKGYNGQKEKLGKCEQFFLELMQVPRVESKLRVFSFKKQFRSQVSDLRNGLDILNSAAAEIRDSYKLKRIMQTILSLGNALNRGTTRGSAVGFRLDSLLKLTDTRAKNNKMTLMHYLCKVVADKLPELLDFWKDFTSLEAASKIQLKYLAEEMQAITKGLEKVVQELSLSLSENDGHVSEKFRPTLKEFLSFAEAEVRSLASLYSEVGKHVDSLILYFGEDPSRCPFEQVVSTLLHFARMFKQAHEENCKQLELEKKKAEKESNTAKLKVTSSPQSGQVLHTPIK